MNRPPANDGAYVVAFFYVAIPMVLFLTIGCGVVGGCAYLWSLL